MRKSTIIISTLFFLSWSVKAQDSVQKPKLKLFDLVVFVGPSMVLPHDLSAEYVTSFSSDRDLIKQSAGYSHNPTYYGEGTDGIEFGLNACFRIHNTTCSFLKRIQPRFSVFAYEKPFFDYEMYYSRSHTIDTLHFTDPNQPPLLIDSVSSGNLGFSYKSQLVMAELGANVSIVTLRYFNFYAGILLGYAISANNEYKFYKRESYSISSYPGQASGRSGDLANISSTKKEPSSSITKISIPVGVQHRFSNRRRFSPGIFAEVKPGIEFYQIKGGRQLTQLVLPVRVGLRVSFDRHK